ncbi:MAG: hypothetical protein JO316_05995 [Abitibacteriaceae bacterium]|nr:hypothetical protein [Abditibacteriaceae bacterium]
MSLLVLLDAGPLGLLTNPHLSEQAELCNRWFESLLWAEVIVALPEIADYEVRRELIRASKTKGLQRLNELKETVPYLPITTEVMLQAATFWAAARQAGKPTADNKALDADVILAAQALLAPGLLVPDEQAEDAEVMIATTNIGHLSRFAQALHWQDIEA